MPLPFFTGWFFYDKESLPLSVFEANTRRVEKTLAWELGMPILAPGETFLWASKHAAWIQFWSCDMRVRLISKLAFTSVIETLKHQIFFTLYHNIFLLL